MNWASLCVRGYHCAVTTCDIVYIKIYFLHKSYRTIFKNILRFLSEPFCLKNKNLRTTKNCHFKTLPFIGLFSVDSSIQIRIKPFVEAVRAKLYVQPLPTYGLIMFFIYLRLLVSLSRLYSINPSFRFTFLFIIFKSTPDHIFSLLHQHHRAAPGNQFPRHKMLLQHLSKKKHLQNNISTTFL